MFLCPVYKYTNITVPVALYYIYTSITRYRIYRTVYTGTIHKQQTQTAGAGVLISYGEHEVYVSEPVRSAGMENLDSRQYF